jgi:hypothetical protein
MAVRQQIICGKCGLLIAEVKDFVPGAEPKPRSGYRMGNIVLISYQGFGIEFNKNALSEGLAWAVCPNPRCGHKTPFDASFLPKPKV